MPSEPSRNNRPRFDAVLWTARGSHRARYLGVATLPGFVPSQPSSAYVLSGRLGTVAGRLPSWHLHSTIRCRNVSEIASTDSGDIVEGSAGGRTIPATSL